MSRTREPTFKGDDPEKLNSKPLTEYPTQLNASLDLTPYTEAPSLK